VLLTSSTATRDCRIAWPNQQPDYRPFVQLLAVRRGHTADRDSRTRVWAEAGAWPFAAFASCLRPEPILSKRSGISEDLRQALAEPRWFG
jgi:hypothetical protein